MNDEVGESLVELGFLIEFNQLFGEHFENLDQLSRGRQLDTRGVDVEGEVPHDQVLKHLLLEGVLLEHVLALVPRGDGILDGLLNPLEFLAVEHGAPH